MPLAQRRLDRLGFGVHAYENCDVAGSYAAPRSGVAPGWDPGGLQQQLDLVRQVAHDRGFGAVSADQAVTSAQKAAIEREAYPERGYRSAVVCGDSQVPVLGWWFYGDELDPGVPESRATEKMPEGFEQRPVGTPVHSERGQSRVGLVSGLEVGVHVRAPERVDRLLRVGNQDEGRVLTGTSEQS